MQDAFTAELHRRLRAADLQPKQRLGPQRRVYLGPDRVRDWIETDYWAELAALPGRPTILAEFDTSPADLGHNVAKYLWRAKAGERFWSEPALLVSAFTETLALNYLVHERIARFLGEELMAASPGTSHLIVGCRGNTPGPEIPRLLAARAVDAVTTWLLAQGLGPLAQDQ